MSKKLTTEEFIEKSKKVHGDRYDYSLVEYKNNNTKVKIICSKHGVFEQTLKNHLNSNCPKCSNNNIKLTKKDFIKKSREIHGNKYDYSLVEYKNNHTKVKIICPKHGFFEQIPYSHLNGFSCKKCSGFNILTTKDFIKKAIEVHGNKYDYSLVEYENSKRKVKIVCPIHGVFEQNTVNHIHLKNNCPKCVNNNIKSTTKDFIKKAIEVHGNRFDYSLVEYENSKTKVKIICPIHGVFEQNTTHHLRGVGCPICNSSKGEIEIMKLLISYSIKYEKQKTYHNCKNIKLLPFDFYLPEYNMCIEYDGRQHYESIKYFGGEKRLKKQKQIDSIKNEYCKNNNIRLIRIKYDEDIEKVLSYLLK
jgi:hypothetical protein